MWKLAGGAATVFEMRVINQPRQGRWKYIRRPCRDWESLLLLMSGGCTTG
jgi:hypothetical protein